jgi:hypothetical protein
MCVMTLANSRYAFIRNIASSINHVHATSYAMVIAWDERSSKRAEQRLNRVGQALHNVVHRTNKPGDRPSR